RVIDGVVDALEHRGQYLAGMQVVLVRVHADPERPGIRRRLQHADTGTAGGVVDDVRPAVDLALGELAAAHRIVPGRSGGPGHVLVDDRIRVGRLHTLHVAAGELADQRDVHAAHEP